MISTLIYLINSFALFIREIHLDKARYREQDRLGDEHIMRQIEKFKKEKGI